MIGPTAPTPLPPELQQAIAAGEVSRILMVGGMFDPPHRAHTELPAQARRHIEQSIGPGCAWLLFIPAAHSPLKTTEPAAGDPDRIEMLRLAIAPLERSALWTDEIDRAAAPAPEPSYTIDTAERARQELIRLGADRSVGLGLLIGTDQALQFHRWRRARDLMAIAEPVVMLCGEVDTPAALAAQLRATGFWTEPEVRAWQSLVVSVAMMDVSSSGLRDLLAHRGPDRAQSTELTAALDPRVLDYIERHRLYLRARNEGAGWGGAAPK